MKWSKTLSFLIILEFIFIIILCNTDDTPKYKNILENLSDTGKYKLYLTDRIYFEDIF